MIYFFSFPSSTIPTSKKERYAEDVRFAIFMFYKFHRGVWKGRGEGEGSGSGIDGHGYSLLLRPKNACGCGVVFLLRVLQFSTTIKEARW